MQDSISLRINEFNEIEGLVFFEVGVEFVDVTVGKKDVCELTLFCARLFHFITKLNYLISIILLNCYLCQSRVINYGF
jgi:hypothetical protein